MLPNARSFCSFIVVATTKLLGRQGPLPGRVDERREVSPVAIDGDDRARLRSACFDPADPPKFASAFQRSVGVTPSQWTQRMRH